MKVANPTIEECYRVLDKANSNIVWEILRQSDTFYQWDHYPKGDVFDQETHSQYYYHAHNPETSTRQPEHGHFHLFMRRGGMPDHIKSKALPENWLDPKNPDDLCHLIAISMDAHGKPLRLFTTNRWVTGEIWYEADAVINLLDYFAIDHSWPSWPTNIWLTEMVRRYKPQIIELIKQRDQTLQDWQAQHPDVNPYEDRQLEVCSALDIT